MTKALDIKLRRDLWARKGPLAAVVLILACGVSAFVSILTTYQSLKASRDAYYGAYRMADLFAPVKKAPRSAVRRLERVDGVRRVEGRIVFDVTIDLPGVAEPISGRTISMPDHPRRAINDLYLTRGRWFSGDGTRQVIVADRFARIHGLDVGDSLPVILNDRKEALRIVGLALSPEYVYMIRGAGEILPDRKRFGVLWLSTSFSESVFDFQDSCNDFVAMLDRHASVEDVITAFDRVLSPYGAIGAFGRKDQLSNRYLENEIQSLEGTATLVPTIFLVVAAFVLRVLTGRLVATQRTQIAVFRAFGYRSRTLAVHYLEMFLLVGLLGGILGTVGGLLFAHSTLKTYGEFYQFPVLRYEMEPGLVFGGVGLGLVSALIGAVGAARNASRLEPAEGLRPEAPAVYHRLLLERWRFFWKRTGVLVRMVLRNLARRKLRAAGTVAGVALAVACVLVSFFSEDSIDLLLHHRYDRVELQDAQVTFHDDRGPGALREIEALPGVRAAEPELSVPVRFRNGWRTHRTGILGLPRGGRLRKILGASGPAIRLSPRGVVLNTKLAEILHVGLGDVVEADVLEGRKPHLHLRVEALVNEYLGVIAYADRIALSRWIGEEDLLTSVLLKVDPLRARDLDRRLKNLPHVAAVIFKKDTIENFRDTIEESQSVMRIVIFISAGAIAFGVLYNAARIALEERRRDLSTLRVLGFTKRETASVLLGENVVLVLLGIVPGLALGYLFGYLLSHAFETDLYRFPMTVSGKSIFYTLVQIALFAILANLSVRAQVRRLKPVEVLKERE